MFAGAVSQGLRLFVGLRSGETRSRGVEVALETYKAVFTDKLLSDKMLDTIASGVGERS